MTKTVSSTVYGLRFTAGFMCGWQLAEREWYIAVLLFFAFIALSVLESFLDLSLERKA